MKVRCKFVCRSVTTEQDWRDPAKEIYSAKFGAVLDGTPEDKAFWQATPAGVLEIGSTTQYFKPGQAYYLDISEAP